MKVFLYKFSVFIIFLVSFLGIIDVLSNELKDDAELVYALFLTITFTLFLVSRKESKRIYLLIFTMFLTASPSFFNICIGLVDNPEISALDCEGHLPMNFGFVNGIALSVGASIALLVMVNQGEYSKSRFLNSLAIIGIVVTLSSFFNFLPTKYLNDKMDNLFEVLIVFPDDC